MGLSRVRPGIIRRGRRSVSDGACRVGPGIIRWGRRSVSDRTGYVGPRLICRGQMSVSDGTGCVVPGIIRRGRTERVGLGWLRQPRNYPWGEKERVGHAPYAPFTMLL